MSEAASGFWLVPTPWSLRERNCARRGRVFAQPVARAGYLLSYHRQRGLYFGGSVPVIARYHAASDCASALSAARSDCAR